MTNADLLLKFMTDEMPPGTDFESALWGAATILIMLRGEPSGSAQP